MRYSKRVQAVIQLARQETARLDHDHISTGHLLLGLIREGEGAAVKFLEAANVDLDEMKTELESIMENKGRGSAIGQLKLTDRAGNALKWADEESQKMGHTYIGTEHLLVGIMREQEGVASKTLTKFGVELDKVRSAARASATNEGGTSETLTFHNVEVTVPTSGPGAGYSQLVSENEVLTLEDACQLLRITIDDLNKLLEAGGLPARMIGGQWRFSRNALFRWLGEGSSLDYLKS